MKNLCSKKVTPEKAYEVWSNGTWTYYVLKKYQNPVNEAKNPYARWYCMTTSPITPHGEYGDAYVSTVKTGTHLIANPLVQTTGGQHGTTPTGSGRPLTIVIFILDEPSDKEGADQGNPDTLS